MQPFSIRDRRKDNIAPTAGRYVTDSRYFPGHAARLAGHAHRINTHRCEQEAGNECSDCIRRTGR